MKKTILGTAIIVSMIMATACGDEPVKITAQTAECSSVVVMNDGSMQSSLTEDFEKDYYDVDELNKFITEDIEKFNSENGTAIKLDSVAVKNSKVNAVFDYTDTKEYSIYSETDAQLISGTDAKSSDLVDKQVNKYGKKSKKDKSSVIKKKHKVFILDNSKGNIKDKVQITVQGEIEYSSNVSKVDNNTAEYSNLDKVAVIVYSPY